MNVLLLLSKACVVDGSVPVSMKDVAKYERCCELQDFVSQ